MQAMTKAILRPFLVSAILWTAGLAEISAPVVIKDFRSPEVIDRAIMISLNEMSEDRAAVLASDHLRAEKSSYRIFRLTIGVETLDILRTLGTGIPNGNGYESYRKVLERAGPVRLPIAQLYATPKGATLLYSGLGRVSERILFGIDPTVFPVAGRRYRLVGFFITETPAAAKTAVPAYSLDLFFVFDGSPSEARTRSIARRMHGLFGAGYGMTVYLRNDPWFLGHAGFASPYRFSASGSVPTEEVYKASTYGVCTNRRLGEPQASATMRCSVRSAI
jgi:hypothetical protein